MTKLRGLVLGTVLAAAVGTACVVTVWWEGNESSISFNWSVNGAAPSAAACSAAGASRVHMWISQYLPSCTLDNENCGMWQRSWEWSCTTGAGATALEFASVDVYVGWALLDDAGSVLDSTPWVRTTLQPGDNNLGTQAFTTSAPGNDAAIVSTWTIDSAASSAAVCTAAGAARVYLTWRETGTTAEQTQYWDCGVAGTATTGLAFRSTHSYDLRWELKDAAGATLSAAPSPTTWSAHTLVAGDNPFQADFITVADPDAAVVSTWTINSLPADAAACTAANAANVVLVYQESGGTPSEVPLTCGSGTGTSGTVFYAGRAYQLRWELRTTAGVVLSAAPSATTWTDVTPVAGDNPVTVNLPVLYGRLDVTLQWGDKVVGPAWGDCASPPHDVAVLGYLLESTTGTVAAEVDITTSPAACTSALAWAGVAYADYHLEIDGLAASPETSTWGGDCLGLAVDDLLANAYTCQVPMLTP